MKKKKSRIGVVNEEFWKRILPIFLSWGFEKHPIEFGRDDYGYHYQFVDSRNKSDVRLVWFVIFSRDCSLSIRGLKNVSIDPNVEKVPSIGGNEKDAFILTRPLSLRHIFDVSFRLEQKRDEPLEAAAARLIEDVIKELPRLKRFLYG